MKEPIFVLSTGRTGTKYFSTFFSKNCENVSSYHTTRYTRFLNVLGNMYKQNIVSGRVVKFIWKRLKYEEIHSHKSRYIECNPYYYNITKIIAQFFPDVKFVYIVRSPKSFIISHIKWENQRWQSIIANRLVPFWQPVPFLDQLKGFRHDYHQRVEFYSKVWVEKNEVILMDMKENDNSLLLKFEDIFDPQTGVDIIKSLVDWLDLELKKPINREIVTARINQTRNDGVDYWDGGCADSVNRICGRVMKELEYEICS